MTHPSLSIDGQQANRKGDDPLNTQTDVELVRRARLGDASALETLVCRHYATAFAVALAVTGERADAEDVCHDALVRACTRIEQCRDPARFAHWLVVIVRNHARNEWAKRVVRRTEPLEAAALSLPVDPEAESMHERARLEDALRQLKPLQREVLLLHDLEGWDHESIARVIGKSTGMTRKTLFLARRRMRELLGNRELEGQTNE